MDSAKGAFDVPLKIFTIALVARFESKNPPQRWTKQRGL
jgi:hypothetical protein